MGWTWNELNEQPDKIVTVFSIIMDESAKVEKEKLAEIESKTKNIHHG